MVESATVVRPPTSSGRAGENADTFIKTFDRYVTCREIINDQKKLNLLAVLLRDSAPDWYESLLDASKKNYSTLHMAFTE